MALTNRFNQRVAIKQKLETQDRDRDSELKKLKSRIKRYAEAYHNDSSIVPDEVYDKDVDKLRKLAPDDPLLRKVGAPVRGAKIALPYTMPSLDKYRSHDFDEIRSRQRGSYFYVSDKIDGSSALIDYPVKNKSLKMYSRGNGVYGQDLSSLLFIINGIGEIKPGEAVRGELALSKTVFKKKFSKTFENARNLVSGTVNSKDRAANEAAKHIVFIAHEFVNPSMGAETGFAKLKSRGFTLPKIKKFPIKTSVKELDEYVKQRKTASDIDLDGIVIEFSNGYRCSYKVDDPPKSATVKEVKWQISKTGLLKPVVYFETPVRLSGASISKATGINARFVMDSGIGPGAKVEVIRAGDVIPKIIGVTKSVKADFPDNAIWDTNKVEAILDTRDKKAVKQEIKKRQAVALAESFKILSIPNFRAQMALKLVEAKITTIADAFSASLSQFKKAGLGDRQAEQLFTALDEALKRVDHPTMMWASGVFPRGYAKSKFSTLLEHYSVSTLKKMSASRMIEAISSLPSMSLESGRAIQSKFDSYITFIDDLGWKPSARTKTGAKESHAYTLQNKTFVFTGFRDTSIENQIVDKGGKVSNSVSKTTTAVVALDARDNKTKAKKARGLGVPVISLTKLREYYLA